MVGLVLAAHGQYSVGLMDAVSVICGEYKNAVTLCLGKNDNCDNFHQRIEEAIQIVDKGDGVIIMTDILGGTPSNQSTLVAHEHNVYCLTGVNLPMLIEFSLSAENDVSLGELADRCLKTAHEGVRMTNKMEDK